MAEVGVVHPDLMKMGGAEAVSVHVLDTLSDDHDVTLLTLNEPDFDRLSGYYDIDISGVSVLDLGAERRSVDLITALETVVGEGRLVLLETAVLDRLVDPFADEFDLLVSTRNEINIDAECVHYVHFPNYATSRREYLINDGYTYTIFDLLTKYVSSIDAHSLDDDAVVANSHWTANLVADEYNVQPEVIFPPISVSEFPDREWNTRENGFVTVGRITPDKSIMEIIRIIEGVRDRGHDVHLHIIGEKQNEKYYQQVVSATNDRDFVSIEGKVSRATLLELLSEHKYGIHGKTYEHFGIVVAEMVAGGVIPFVPDAGGQVEVINECDRLTYETPEECEANIAAVLNDTDLQTETRNELPPRDCFSAERFRTEFRSVMEAVLSGT